MRPDDLDWGRDSGSGDAGAAGATERPPPAPTRPARGRPATLHAPGPPEPPRRWETGRETAARRRLHPGQPRPAGARAPQPAPVAQYPPLPAPAPSRRVLTSRGPMYPGRRRADMPRGRTHPADSPCRGPFPGPSRRGPRFRGAGSARGGGAGGAGGPAGSAGGGERRGEAPRVRPAKRASGSNPAPPAPPWTLPGGRKGFIPGIRSPGRGLARGRRDTSRLCNGSARWVPSQLAPAPPSSPRGPP